jgi:hypothetical protein
MLEFILNSHAELQKHISKTSYKAKDLLTNITEDVLKNE